MKKILSVMMAMAMTVTLFAGCQSSSTEQQAATSSESAGGAAEATEVAEGAGIQINKEDLKVALVLPGSINDQGWCTLAYLGLQAIQSDYGLSDDNVTFMESVGQSDQEDAFRSLAQAGYNVIYGHGSEYYDAAATVAEEFPDVAFIVTSTDQHNGTNVASVNTLPTQMGALAGVAAANASKSRIVGAVGGMSLVSIVGAVNAFSAAALMTDPELTVLTNMTGDDEDQAKCKEVALEMISQGADVIFYDADAAGLGALEACEEKGVMAIPAIAMPDLETDAILMAATNNLIKAMDTVVQYIIDGTFVGDFYPMGCDVDCVGYEDAQMDDATKAAVEDLYQQFKSGSADVTKIIADNLTDDVKVE